MIKMNCIATTVYFVSSLFCSLSVAQLSPSNDEAWNAFRNSAHQIGFCVYHIQKEACEAHLEVKRELEIASDPESDVYYFLLEPSWAKKRLVAWAESKDSSPENYFILFDIDQGSARQLHDSVKTSNSYMMFSMFDMRDEFMFQNSSRSNNGLNFKIRSKRAQSIVSNTMWREFMSNRSGRLENEIRISLKGPHAAEHLEVFKEAFQKTVEN